MGSASHSLRPKLLLAADERKSVYSSAGRSRRSDCPRQLRLAGLANILLIVQNFAYSDIYYRRPEKESCSVSTPRIRSQMGILATIRTPSFKLLLEFYRQSLARVHYALVGSLIRSRHMNRERAVLDHPRIRAGSLADGQRVQLVVPMERDG